MAHQGSPPVPPAGAAARLSAALLLVGVRLPALKTVPQPFSFRLGLQEMVLLTGLPLQEADLLLHLAANLLPPQEGVVFHWGQHLRQLPRMRRYQQQGRIALISPLQSLWRRLRLRDNLALPKTLSGELTVAEVSARAQDLWERLQLHPWLEHYPHELPPLIYHLALWGRELLKEPELILGLLPVPEPQLAALPQILWPVLLNYWHSRPVAVLLAGQDLRFASAEADRLCQITATGWQDLPLPGRGRQTLLSYLPLF